jgi:hypothetical protein
MANAFISFAFKPIPEQPLGVIHHKMEIIGKDQLDIPTGKAASVFLSSN